MRKPVGEQKHVSYGYWAVPFGLMLVGLSFLVYRLAAGLWTTDMDGSTIWISFFVMFIGLSAGSFLLSTLVYVFNITRYERIGRMAVYSAVLCLMMGILFVFADLGHFERFWQVFANVANTSVLWFEVMFYVLYVIILVVELYFLTRTDLIALREKNTGLRQRLYRVLALGSQRQDQGSKDRDMRMVKILGIIGLPTAIAVHGGTGAVFAVVEAVPHWHSPLLPIVFITSALASGAALLLFLRAFFMRPAADEPQFLSGLAKLAIGLLAVDWVLVIFEFLVPLYGGIPGAVDPLHEMFFGANWWVFWIIQVFIGLLLPIFIVSRAKSGTWLGLGGLAIVVGIVAVRWNIVVPGLSIAKVEGLSGSFFSDRITVLYSPTAVEWMSTIGLLALFTVLLWLGMRILPLQAREYTTELEGGQ